MRLNGILLVALVLGTSVAESASKIDFTKDVQPILEARCLKCHSRGKLRGGFSLETRASLLAGGESGKVIEPGKSTDSVLLKLVAGTDPDQVMPPEGERLSAEQVATLKAWIDQGAVWPEGLDFGFRKASIAPRKPDVPVVASPVPLTNPIDRFVADSWTRNKQPVEFASISDRHFARRVHFDLIGLPPSPELLVEFDADTRPNKREVLIDKLLTNRRAYADHWLSYWNDLLRNAYRGTGFIDGGRKTITSWLYQSLYDNKPYDRFAHELISPVAGSEGFTKGIVWRGVVNASQVPPVQAAQNVGQIFLGTNLKCASCHDSFVNHWKLEQAYALSSVFADKPLEVHRCDKPTGKTSSIGFLYPELGQIDADKPKAERLKQLADIMVKPTNGRFSRTMVNRLWAQLLGRGIVESVDDMDRPAWHQDLLDWLATDFVEHGHDLQHTLKTICLSRTYSLPSVGLPKPDDKDEFVFRGPFVRRLSAEQFVDAVSTLTGQWDAASPALFTVDGRGQGGQLQGVAAAVSAAARAASPATKPAPIEAQWIWSHKDALQRDPGGTYLFRRSFKLTAKPQFAPVIATCDNEFVLFVNGRKVAASQNWEQPLVSDIAKFLQVGENVIAIEATNWPDLENKKGTQFKGDNPAALIFFASGVSDGKTDWTLGTDAEWLWSKTAPAKWQQKGFDTAGWQHASELAPATKAYSGANLAQHFASSPQGGDVGSVRSALAFDDPLTRALGRPSRDQTLTRRESIATTLQALELFNGPTLDDRLKRGAAHWQAKKLDRSEQLVEQIYETALGRKPLPTELAAAIELTGATPTSEGIEDLLWAVTMLPEFQLLR